MINELHIERFMDIEDETLELKPLTVIAGVNSAGKSAVIQAILAILKKADEKGDFLLSKHNFDFSSAICKYDAYDNYAIELDTDAEIIKLSVNKKAEGLQPERPSIGLESNVFYLSANRMGYDNMELKADRYCAGVRGEYLFGTLYKEKDNPIKLDMGNNEVPHGLGMLVNFWLREIFGTKFNVNTKEENANIVVSYDADDLKGLMPNQLGTAVSYLTKVLILCLRSKPGDVLMIENPEINLHPKAQAKLGEFLTVIANAGVQMIIETHSENLVNKIQYQIYSDKFDAEKLAIYYKEKPRAKFEKVVIDGNGRYSVDFPEGFFDASLGDLMEIG